MVINYKQGPYVEKSSEGNLGKNKSVAKLRNVTVENTFLDINYVLKRCLLMIRLDGKQQGLTTLSY